MSRKDHPEAWGIPYPARCEMTPETWAASFGCHKGTLVPRKLLRVQRTVDDRCVVVAERYEAVLTSMPKGLPSSAPVSDWTPRPSEDDELQKSWGRLPPARHDSDQVTSVRDAEAQLSES